MLSNLKASYSRTDQFDFRACLECRIGWKRPCHKVTQIEIDIYGTDIGSKDRENRGD